ncbi:MAG: FG-GAP-like repeat-containing protein, partial [Desulfobulbaceae bacterium]|nr:FG-GAP-like repeat-containing protein [Desulfobulbaceae bacterium]
PPPYAGIGELYQYQVQAVDPDKNTLSFSLLRAPEGMAIDPVTGVISWTPIAEQLGKQYITIKVEDGQEGEDVQPGEITVLMPSPIDLEPININLDNTTVDPQTLQFTGTAELEIRNNGEGFFAGGYRVILFEDSNYNQTYDPDDNILASRYVSGEHNGGDTRTITFELDAHVSFVDNLIYAFADSLLKVDESIESNNIIHSKSGCEHKPEVGEFKPVLEWEWTGSDTFPLHNQVMMAPVVANLSDDNGDGFINQDDIPDIVFSSYYKGSYGSDGKLRAISGDGGGELFTVTSQPVRPGVTPATGDIDGDGISEIITLSDDGYLFNHVVAFENDGTLKWKSPLLLWGAHSIDIISIADLDADGLPEIICGNVVLNHDGTKKWIANSNSGVTSIVADLNLDGKLEYTGGGFVYDCNGQLLWRVKLPGEGAGFQGVANFDDDPYPEIVIVKSGFVYLLEHTGEIIWGPIDLPPDGTAQDQGGPPTIADFDSDGLPEIGVAGARCYVVFESDGSIKWTMPISDTSSHATGSSAFDFEGDGSTEVVYSDEAYLRIFRGSDGTVLFKVRIGSWTLIELPVIVDVDNDNNAEIVVASNSYPKGGKTGIQVFGDENDTWVNTRKIWNQHAYSITNVNDDGTIPRVVANNWDTFNNFRQNQMLNPFGCQDLSASYLRADQGGYPESITFTARVGNSGVLAIGPGTKVSFYHGDPLAGGAL